MKEIRKNVSESLFYCRMAFDNLYFERDESFPLAGFAVCAVCLGGFLFHFSLIHNF